MDGEHFPKEVIAVITRDIKPGHEQEYEEWLRRYMMLENKVPGYHSMVFELVTYCSSSFIIKFVNY